MAKTKEKIVIGTQPYNDLMHHRSRYREPQVFVVTVNGEQGVAQLTQDLEELIELQKLVQEALIYESKRLHNKAKAVNDSVQRFLED